MKMKWSFVLLAVLGITAALCAALLTASIRAKPITAALRDVPETVPVLVARVDAPARTMLTADVVEVKEMARTDAPAGALSDPAQAIGKVTAVPLLPGQAVTRDVFPQDGKGLQLAGILPSGKRAVSVSLSDYSGLEGLLYPGCVVDVLAAFDITPGNKMGKAVSTTLLENIEVLAVEKITVASSSEGEEVQNSSRRYDKKLLVALMVDAKQAEALQLAMEHGDISLAMRNPQDAAEVASDATLLSDGRLAQLAEVLGAAVPAEEKPAPAPEPEPEVEPEPKPKGKPRPRPQFTVEVFRGVEMQSYSFSEK